MSQTDTPVVAFPADPLFTALLALADELNVAARDPALVGRYEVLVELSDVVDYTRRVLYGRDPGVQRGYASELRECVGRLITRLDAQLSTAVVS